MATSDLQTDNCNSDEEDLDNADIEVLSGHSEALQKLGNEYIEHGNTLVNEWLCRKANIANSHDLNDTLRSDQLKDWAINLLQSANYKTDVLDEIFEDLVEGLTLHDNGEKDEEIHRVLKQLNAIGLRNKKTVLHIKLPLHGQTVLKSNGEEIAKLSLTRDNYVRSLQYRSMKKMFGLDDPKLKDFLHFPDEVIAFKSSDIKENITHFLYRCGNPISQYCCIQATIILNGHGTENGDLALADDSPMSYYGVMKHVEQTAHDVWRENMERGLPQLPYGIIVLNGLCYSYKAPQYETNNSRIQSKIFTNPHHQETKIDYRCNYKVVLPDKYKLKIVASRHLEINEHAADEYFDEVDSGTLTGQDSVEFAIVGRFVKPDDTVEGSKLDKPQGDCEDDKKLDV